jgi:hypothetical protein
LIVGKPQVIIAASVSAKPRLPVHDTQVEALRVVVVDAQRLRSNRDRASRGTSARQHGVRGRRLV